MLRKSIWMTAGVVLGIMLLLGLSALAQVDTADDNGGLTAEVAADFVERFDAVFNEDLDLIDDLFAANFVSHHLPLAPPLDTAGLKAYIASFYEPFPDLRQTTNKYLISGDHLIVHVTYTGTQNGNFFGVEPTGIEVAMNGIGIFRFEDGQAVDNWAVIDVAGLLVQTGAWLPPVPED